MKAKSFDEAERYLQEAGICLRREGFGVEPKDAGLLAVSWQGAPLCLVTDSGGVRWRESWVERQGGDEALDRARVVARRTEEYMGLLEAAPALKAHGLDGSYKLLNEFNGAVLAAHHSSRQGWQFITWCRDYSGEGVTQGHYVGGNYEGAKRDFAIRAGLVPQSQMFSEDQLAEIHRCVDTVRDMDIPMTAEREQRMDGILDQIKRAVPDLDARIGQAQNADGQIADQTFGSQMM